MCFPAVSAIRTVRFDHATFLSGDAMPSPASSIRRVATSLATLLTPTHSARTSFCHEREGVLSGLVRKKFPEKLAWRTGITRYRAAAWLGTDSFTWGCVEDEGIRDVRYVCEGRVRGKRERVTLPYATHAKAYRELLFNGIAEERVGEVFVTSLVTHVAFRANGCGNLLGVHIP